MKKDILIQIFIERKITKEQGLDTLLLKWQTKGSKLSQ